MELTSLFDLQGMIFLLVIIGIMLRRKGILPEQGKTILTDLVIYAALPCNILNSFQIPFDLAILKRFAVILLVATGVQIVSMILANVLYRQYPASKRKVLQYATVVSNAGFMGSPIAEGVFGAEGLMFGSVYLVPVRIVMWSAGVSYFTESPDHRKLLKRIVTHPCIVAVYIGFFLMLTQLPLPVFLQSAIKSIGSCTTPLSMILIGTILAEVEVKSILNWVVCGYTAVRLVAIPLIIWIICRVLQIDPLISGVSVLLAGMPAGSTTAILASKYRGDYIFATKCVVVSSILSMVSVPLWCLVLANF